MMAAVTQDPELEAFKTEIDLRAFAESEGYALDRRESWRGSSVMRSKSADKIVVKRDADNHYIYFSVRNDGDNGSTIDFLLRIPECADRPSGMKAITLPG